jgi:hypothetical protein
MGGPPEVFVRRTSADTVGRGLQRNVRVYAVTLRRRTRGPGRVPRLAAPPAQPSPDAARASAAGTSSHPDLVSTFEAANDHYTFDLDTREDAERLEVRLRRTIPGWREGAGVDVPSAM